MRKNGLVERLSSAPRWLSLLVLPVAIVVAVGASSASGAPAQTGWLPTASGKLTKVIVLLRNAPGVSPTALHAAPRLGGVRAEGPLTDALVSHGAKALVSGTSVPYVVASVSSAQEKALRANPAVRAVFPDAVISAPKPAVPAEPQPLSPAHAGKTTSAPCGTASNPETDPEALGVIKSTQANALGYDGAGVKVAYIAGPIDTTIPDFQRNAKYASAGSPAGSPVVTAMDFTGDPANTPNGDAAAESFIDAGSIVAQGNETYNIADYVNSAHPLPSTCDIKVTGAAPGASVLGLNVFSATHDTTESNFIQAIDYAVTHGVKVLNESFTANNFPDTALDATRIADDIAISKGVTVVVSTGDSGITSTIGSPATDPKTIGAGASTTFRVYQQDTFGGINATSPTHTNGKWVDNNISGLSSGGFSQAGGKTVDLVAPGDLNWGLCSPNVAVYDACTDDNGNPTGLQLAGGTSESAPLTSAAAADVIQAYAKTHGGKDPTPALVKQILLSTATDIQAPAEQQGAGLLDVLAAVKEAASVDNGKGKHDGSLLLSKTQINISQDPGHTAKRKIGITNTGSKPVTVHLSTRTLTDEIAHEIGSFCLNPSSSTSACGPPTSNTFLIWSGVKEVYQETTFSVPHTGKVSRLNFSATYPYTGQGSLLHIALYDPSGAYAGYSLPQGLANYANIQVADPRPGVWTAVFFTEQDGATPGATGTAGEINWEADTWTFGHGGSISPSKLTIGAGDTAHATFKAKSPKDPGDVADSIVLASKGTANTIPVTVRTRIPTGHGGGAFAGVLTGGNGRGNPAQTNTYVFNVPKGEKDLDVSAALADPNDGVIAMLKDPAGQVVASSSNQTFDSTASNVIGTGAVNVYADHPTPGEWSLLLDWIQPVSGAELSEPFTGSVGFNKVQARSNLPSSTSTRLKKGKTYIYRVKVKNTAQSPEMFFLDPRMNHNANVRLPDQNGSDHNMTLPLPPGLNFPFYIVPTDTHGLETNVTGSGPVTYDIEPFSGDPDLSPALPEPGAPGSQSGNTAKLSFVPSSGEVETGLWYLNPSEIGPYPAAGASPITANANFYAYLQAFDPSVQTGTGDFWTWVNGMSKGFAPVYLQPGQSATIPVAITPSQAGGRKIAGTIRVGDVFQVNYVTGFAFGGGDELASIPFAYTVQR